ncbi:MAG TPA: hypothetical protein VKK79_20320, partial [Candidatus Lokiarchaeia archaeon]|nr:hypothetical protein [Candidatus Lokiarchaeia archaeon]
MELGVLDALNWVTTICDQLEKHILSAAKDFEAFFKNVSIRIDPSAAILQTESAIEITTDALYSIQIQNLLEEGFSIQRLSLQTSDEKTYAISFR